jgi:hypothetical protein
MRDSAYLAFVEPEYDSIGAFLYGVYRHYALTADVTFLGDSAVPSDPGCRLNHVQTWAPARKPARQQNP